MNLQRRTFLAGLIAATAGCSGANRGGPYPSDDIDFIIPTGAGGGADMYARLIGNAMELALPEQVNVIPRNIPSGGGGKGIVQLYNAPPDGYSIGILNVPGLFVLQKRRNMPYDFTRFTWLGSFTTGENYGVAVGWDSPIRDIEDLWRLARQRELTFATTGPEGMAYTATQISSQIMGLPYRLVSGYRGSSDYVVAAMRGDTDAVVAAISTLKRLQSGRALRVLAAFNDEENGEGVPNAIDIGYPELVGLRGDRVVAAPPGLPEDRRDYIAAALARAWEYRPFLDWAENMGESIDPRTPEETSRMVEQRRAFLERWDRADDSVRRSA